MDKDKKPPNTHQEGNEAEDFLMKVIIKIVATTAIMAAITVAAIYYMAP